MVLWWIYLQLDGETFHQLTTGWHKFCAVEFIHQAETPQLYGCFVHTINYGQLSFPGQLELESVFFMILSPKKHGFIFQRHPQIARWQSNIAMDKYMHDHDLHDIHMK